MLVSIGGQARMFWYEFGASVFNNCVNSRSNSVAASCHNIMLPISNSGSEFRISARITSCIRKKAKSHDIAERIQELDSRVEFKWKRYSGPFGGKKSPV